jgi:hypothetical protein
MSFTARPCRLRSLLIVRSMLHIRRNDRLSGEEMTTWVVLALFLSFIALPICWCVIAPRPPRDGNAAGRTAHGRARQRARARPRTRRPGARPGDLPAHALALHLPGAALVRAPAVRQPRHPRPARPPARASGPRQPRSVLHLVPHPLADRRLCKRGIATPAAGERELTPPPPLPRRRAAPVREFVPRRRADPHPPRSAPHSRASASCTRSPRRAAARRTDQAPAQAVLDAWTSRRWCAAGGTPR